MPEPEAGPEILSFAEPLPSRAVTTFEGFEQVAEADAETVRGAGAWGFGAGAGAGA